MEVDLIFLIIIIATFATAFLSSIFGMLGGLILMGILVSILSVGPAMVLHGLIQTTSNGYRAWLNRRDIKWEIIWTLLLLNDLAFKIIFLVSSFKILSLGASFLSQMNLATHLRPFMHIFAKLPSEFLK